MAEIRRIVENYELWSHPLARLYSDRGDRRPYGEDARTAGGNRIRVAGRRMDDLRRWVMPKDERTSDLAGFEPYRAAGKPRLPESFPCLLTQETIEEDVA